MLGKTPKNIVALRPLKDGVISDFEVTQKLIQSFILRVLPKHLLFGPRVIMCIPSGATRVERKAVVDAALGAKARKVWLVPEPVAATIGADLPISEPVGNMIVDIGGGTSEAAVTSLEGVVISKSVRIGGDEMDQAIIYYFRDQHNLLIGEQTAERVKISIGCAYPLAQRGEVKVRGRDLATGFPKEMVITSEEVREVLAPVVLNICEMIEDTLEETPPELAGDIMERGIYLSGGGAYLKGIDKYISERVKLPVKLVPEPMLSVALGAGKLLEREDLLSKVEVTP